MASVYLDTSALIKRYIEEEGTARVIALTKGSGSDQVIILDIALVESRSAVRRREREGDIADSDAARILQQIEEDASTSFLLQPSTSAVMEEAARLIDRYPLRTYDALQLAGCLVARRGVTGPLTFVCADARLCDTASLEGLTVLNPQSPGNDS